MKDDDSGASAPVWRSASVDWPVTTGVGPGLRGAVAEATRVAWLDGQRGRLFYRGIPVEALAREASFEEVAFLLMTGTTSVDAPERWNRFRHQLAGPRYLLETSRCLLALFPPGIPPADRLRAAISALGGPDVSDRSLATILGRVLALVVAVAQGGSENAGPPAADDDPSIAGRLLRAITGGDADPARIGVMNRALIAFADGGLAPPTFASLIVASSHGDAYSALVAGLCAAMGDRMDGAATELAELYTHLPGPGAARLWVQETLADGRRLPGFGHRIFRSGDPRVPILAGCAHELSSGPEELRRLEVVNAIAAEGTRLLGPKGVGPNVHLHGALVFLLLGAAPAFIPCIMAVARLAGAVARMHEYTAQNRIIRPLEVYVGPSERPFVPVALRGDRERET